MNLHLPTHGYRLFAIGSIFMMMLVAETLCAQITNIGNNTNKGLLDNQKVISKDTAGFAEKAEDQSVQIFYQNNQGQRFQYDTSILDIHRYQLLDTWSVDLGNLGSAYQSLKAMAALPVQFTLLPHQQQAYRFTHANLNFYNATKPVSEVAYTAGSRQEQLIELFHTQNIKPNWNFSTRYRKINSLGYYQAQKNNIDNFSFVTHYQSANQRYNIQAALLYNKLQQDENLGVASDTFFNNDRFDNLYLIPVRVNVANGVTRSPILNYRRDVELHIKQEYAIGKQEEQIIRDTVKTMVFKPIITFSNKVYYTAERYCLQHNRPDTAFQNNYFFQAFPMNDTLRVAYENQLLGTTFSAEGNIYLRQRVFSLLAGVGFEYQRIGGDARQQDAVNNYVFTALHNRKSIDTKWLLDANLNLYYTGMARGNLRLNGTLSRTILRHGVQVGFKLGQYIQQPFFVAQSLQFGGAEAFFNFRPQVNTQFGGFIRHDGLGLDLEASVLLFNQLIYAQGFQPDYFQYNKTIQITQFDVGKTFAFGKWTFINRVLLQIAPENTPINIPLLASFHRFAFHDDIFKGKMEVSTGLDIAYNSPYYFDNYQPVFQNFTPQSTIRQVNFPRLQPFFNFRIKRFRASVSLDQVQHNFTPQNLNYNRYGAQNMLIRFGLRWVFVN